MEILVKFLIATIVVVIPFLSSVYLLFTSKVKQKQKTNV